MVSLTRKLRGFAWLTTNANRFSSLRIAARVGLTARRSAALGLVGTRHRSLSRIATAASGPSMPGPVDEGHFGGGGGGEPADHGFELVGGDLRARSSP
jgi:hypothetical protein